MLDPIYMIRGGSFGTAFDTKLYMALFAVGLVLWDVFLRKRRDYVYVLVVGTATWTLVELVLQATGMRVMHGRELFGLPVPLWLGALLQGLSEGSAIAVGGVFFGDRFLDRRTRVTAAIGFAALCAVVVLVSLSSSPHGAAGDELIPSRRNMTAIPALLFLTALMAINVVFWVRCPKHRWRATAMTVVMVVFAAAWTGAEVASSVRWIEVDGPGESFVRAPLLISTAALSFDVVVEIALAYVPFLAVPVLLGAIDSEDQQAPE